MPALDEPEQRRRLADAPVARLATLRADGTPRLVPMTFALVDGVICSVVDEVKAKTSLRLARLADIARDPRVALVVDRYDDDWSQLWWVRVDGTATVLTEGVLTEGVLTEGVLTEGVLTEGALTEGPLREAAVTALRAKYPQYQGAELAGPVLTITPTRWTGWAAAG